MALRDHGNYSLKFDGSNDWVDFGTSNFAFERTQPFSVSMWVNQNAATAQSTIISRANVSPNFQGWWIRYERATCSYTFYLISSFSTNYLAIRTSAVPNYGQFQKWVRVGLTYDGSSTAAGTKFYIDGVAATQTTVANTLSASTVAAGINARMGTLTDDTIDYNGNLTDVAVYTDVLTAQEIRDIHFNGIYPNDNLYARYLFNEGSGSTLTDSSGNGRNGTITAATWSTAKAPLQLARTVAGTRTTAGTRTVVS